MNPSKLSGRYVTAKLLGWDGRVAGDGTVYREDLPRVVDVAGVLTVRRVDALDYTQFVVAGRPVDPATVSEVRFVESMSFASVAAPVEGRYESYPGTVGDVDAELDLTDAHARVERYLARWRTGEFRYNAAQPRDPAGTPTGGQWTKAGVAVDGYMSMVTVDADGGHFDLNPRYGPTPQSVFDWHDREFDDAVSDYDPDRHHRAQIEATFQADENGNIVGVDGRWLSGEGEGEAAFDVDERARQAFIDHFEAIGINVWAPEQRFRVPPPPELGEDGWVPRTAIGDAFVGDGGRFTTRDGTSYTIELTAEDADDLWGDGVEGYMDGRVAGYIIDDDTGGIVATFDRAMSGTLVTNDRFFMERAYQGKGIGAAFLNHTESRLAQFGAEEVQLQAVDVGKYAWAARGYRLDDERNRWSPTRDWLETARSYEVGPDVDERLDALEAAWDDEPYDVYPIDLVAIDPQFKDVLLDGPNWYGTKEIDTRERPERWATTPFDEFAYNPSQPRDDHGRWTSTASARTWRGTGVPEVDEVIAAFLVERLGDWTTDDTRICDLTPEQAHGSCQSVAEQFVEFAEARGLDKVYATHTNMDEMGYEVTAGPYGEVLDDDGNIVAGNYYEHTVNQVYVPGQAFPITIDFTAKQYGYDTLVKVDPESDEVFTVPPLDNERVALAVCDRHQFAGCQDASCAPPPAGTGGSLPGGTAIRGGAEVVVDAPAVFGKLSPKVRTSTPDEWVASPDDFAAAVELANHKARNVPQPSPEQIAKNLAAEAKARAEGGRPGGHGRGNSYIRRERAEALFREFGGHKRGYCPCTGCGIKVSPGGRGGHAAMQQDKILTTREGGTYGTAKSGFPNLIPACGGCNNSRNAAPHEVRPVWETELPLVAAAGDAQPVVVAFPLGWDDPNVDTVAAPIQGVMMTRTVTAWFGTYTQTVVGGEVVDPATVRPVDVKFTVCDRHQFAGCTDASCAPPPVGTGGSLPGGGLGVRPSVKYGSTFTDMREAMLAIDDIDDEAMMDYRQSVEEYVGQRLYEAYASAVPDDWTVHVSFSMDETGGDWMVDIESPDVAPVISMVRSLSYREGVGGVSGNNEWVVHHDAMDVRSAFQGQGYGQAISDAAEDVYRELGVNAIELTAAAVGRYAWAAAGYDWLVRSALGDEGVADRPLHALLDRAASHVLNADLVAAPRIMGEIRELRGRIDDGDIPIPYEFAMVGRGVWVDADGMWPGKYAILGGPNWDGRREL